MIENFPVPVRLLGVLLPLFACAGLLVCTVLTEKSKAFAQFVKYGAIGVVATYIQTIVFYLLAAGCLGCLAADDWAVKLLGLPPSAVNDSVRAFRFAVSTAAGFVLSNFVCWLLNRAFVFTPGRYRWPVELALFYAASTTATVLALALSWALIRYCSLMTSAAVFLEILVSFFVNFFVRKFLIFKG